MPSAQSAQPFGFVRRVVTVFIGLCALSATGYLISPTLFVPSTSRAMINARLVSVRTPYPGDVAGVPVRAGDTVSAGQTLVRIAHPNPDTRTLARIRAENGEMSDRVEGLIAQRGRLTALRQELTTGVEEYRTSCTERLGHRLVEARAAHEAAKAKRNVSEWQFARQTKLHAAGASAVDEKQLMEAQLALDRGTEAQACAVVKQLEAELGALGKGIFIGSQVLPYQRQRIDDVAVLLAELDVRLSTARSQFDQSYRLVQVESDLLASLATQDLKAPIDGLVFRRLVEPGTHIEGKTEVIQLVDPRQVFVEAVVGRRDFQVIEAGDPVRLRLDGTWTWFSGRVTHKRGLWSARPEGEFAATLPPGHKDGDYRVTVTMDELPAKALASNCYLAGTRIEVTFPRSPARGWEDLFSE